MRNFLLGFLFTFASSWAAELDWVHYQFEEGYLKINTDKICTVDTSYINCMGGEGLAYYSQLDTNFAVVFRAESRKLEIYAMPLDTATGAAYQHTVAQILRNEFMDLQNWGILDMSKDSAQKLIDQFVKETSEIQFTYRLLKKECETDKSQCRATLKVDGYDGSLTDRTHELLPQKKFPDTNSSDSASVPLSLRSNLTNETNYRIKPGTPYQLFDMNGNFIENGIWQGSLSVRKVPTIIRFKDGRNVLH